MNVTTVKNIRDTEAFKDFTSKYNDLYRTKEIIDKIISDGPILEVMPYPEGLVVLKGATFVVQGHELPFSIAIVASITGLTAIALPASKIANVIIEKSWGRYLSSLGCDKDFVNYFNKTFNLRLQTSDMLIPILSMIGIDGTDKFKLALNKYEYFRDRALANAERHDITELKEQLELDKTFIYTAAMGYKLS